MSGIMIAVTSLCAIAAVCGVVLVVASKYVAVTLPSVFIVTETFSL